MRSLLKSIFKIILIAFSLQFHGCSLVGLGIGAIADANAEPGQYKIYDEHVSDIDAGDPLTVVLKNGESRSGMYLGFKDMSTEEYAVLYDNFREDIFIKLPDLKETISINSGFSNAYNYEYVFEGFDYNGIRVKKLNKIEPESYDIESINFLAFSYNDSDQVVQKDLLTNFLLSGELPLISKIVLQNPDGVFEFGSGEISELKFTADSDSWLVGLAVGSIIDMVIIGIIAGNGIFKMKWFKL